MGDCRLLTTKRATCCTSTSDANPGPATDSELTDNDIIVRYDGEGTIGLTILRASQRQEARIDKQQAFQSVHYGLHGVIISIHQQSEITQS